MADTRKARITVDQARRLGRVVSHAETELDAGPASRGRGGTRRTAGVHFVVVCTIDGGLAGSISTTCSWTYTVTSPLGHTYGEEMTPERRRLVNVPYTETPANTRGVGYFDEDGEFRLYCANETPLTQVCPPDDVEEVP
jgi:hypothetical protein